MPNSPLSKKKIREQLDADVQAFLRKGGKITQFDQRETNSQTKEFVTDVAKSPEKEQR